MKKYLALTLAVLMVFSLFVGCTKPAEELPDPEGETTTPETPDTAVPDEVAPADDVEITMWTYPVGSFKDAATVDGFIASFNEIHPEIKVTVEYLDYASGDDQVTASIEAGTAPDIILEGPERLVSNWGAKGKMVDLADLWDEEAVADISANSEAVVNACKSPEGVFYEYPLCMTTHCMAINYEVFEAADALQYIDEETRTWTTENFVKALEAVAAKGDVKATGIVYCGGQGGDQGTRALASNLYSAQFTDADHTTYTMNDENGVKGLQLLADLVEAGTLSADAGIAAADELQLFANGTAAMSFCWNASNEATYASQVAFTPYAMAFPTDDGVPELAGGIWGFGIFNNEDDAKIAASKTFIEFMADDATQGPISVAATGFFPARASYGNVYAGTENEERMATYGELMPYLGDYYNVTPNWPQQRTAWFNLLQKIFADTDVQTAADDYVAESMA